METTVLPTKSFKEVHKDLENESLFLRQNHDLQGFKEKADFLSAIGLTNSIATKLYSQIFEKASVIQRYNDRYHGLHIFLLAPQLERLCEKYNLYVRPLQMFLGDIPEKNIQDMMNFKVSPGDIFSQDGVKILRQRFEESHAHKGVSFFTKKFSLLELIELGVQQYDGAIEIAAVRSLFSPKAFEKSEERIIGLEEVDPKFEVDLDPIVLLKTHDGYLVLTAWGDEANDELLFNKQNN